jgi:hypothetical protein
MNEKPTVLIELDGTLIYQIDGNRDIRFGKPYANAAWFVKQLKEFSRPMIYTTRLNMDQPHDLTEKGIDRAIRLESESRNFHIPIFRNTSNAKPLVACHVDSRSIRCAPDEGSDYGKVLKEIEEVIKRG